MRASEFVLSELIDIEVDLSAPTPVYRQIADGIRIHLVSGRLKPGEQLPTVRRLAIDLGVNHNTVAEAYRLLCAEGWLDLGRGRGATIRSRSSPRATPQARGVFEKRLRELAAEARGAGVPPRTMRQALLELARALGADRRRT